MKLFVNLMVPAVLLAGSLAGAQEAPAGNAGKLKGSYAVVIEEECVYSPSGFGPGPVFDRLGPTTHGASTLKGVATLNADGTGEMAVSMASIGTNASISPALGYQLTCPLQYAVDADGKFDAQYDCTGTTTLGTGSRIGLAVFQNGMHVSGHARNKRFVLAAGTELLIESVGSEGSPATSRMCHRTFQLLKTKERAEG